MSLMNRLTDVEITVQGKRQGTWGFFFFFLCFFRSPYRGGFWEGRSSRQAGLFYEEGDKLHVVFLPMQGNAELSCGDINEAYDILTVFQRWRWHSGFLFLWFYKLVDLYGQIFETWIFPLLSRS